MTRTVVIRIDDIEWHKVGCDCGLCCYTGQSYGASIYPFPQHPEGKENPGKERPRYYDEIEWGDSDAPDDDWLEDALFHAEPLERIYAPSHEAALHNARLECRTQGWILHE